VSSKKHRSADRQWEKDFLDKQRVTGTHAYQCRYCGETTRTERDLVDHFLESCRRIPISDVTTKPSAGAPQRSALEYRVRPQSRGSIVKSQQLADRTKEFHPAKPVADPQSAPRLSGAQIRKHDRDILRRRAEELDAAPTPTRPLSRGEPEEREDHIPEYVPCSCGGSNENCSHCFGLGQVRSHHPSPVLHKLSFEVSSPPNNTYKKKHKQRGASAKVRPRVPMADPEFRVGSMDSPTPEDHKCQLYPDNQKQQVRTQASRSRNSLVQCLACREIVRASILGLHYSARHSGTHNLIHHKQNGHWAICPVCNLSVKKLAKHMRCHDQKASVVSTTEKQSSERERLINLGYIVPASRPRLVAAQVPRRIQRKPESKRSELRGRASALDNWKDELQKKEDPNSPINLDYTRPYAHGARENGRFGSHPSHDGFDDESGA
jgi:hypothetical protein